VAGKAICCKLGWGGTPSEVVNCCCIILLHPSNAVEFKCWDMESGTDGAAGAPARLSEGAVAIGGSTLSSRCTCVSCTTAGRDGLTGFKLGLAEYVDEGFTRHEGGIEVSGRGGVCAA